MKFSDSTKRIMWIDDDVLLLDKQIDLVKKAGWPIIKINSADDAYEEFKNNKPEYRGILLDTMMDPTELIGPHHVSGILTGALLAKRAISEQHISRDRVVFLTNCKQQIFLDIAIEIGIPVHSKSRYHGRDLTILIERCFGDKK